MTWTGGVTRATGDIVTAAIWNAHLGAGGDLDDLSTHVHSGAAGQGSTSLGPLVKADFTDAAAPAAPGAGKTRIYTVSGRLRTRAGAAGADSQIVSSLDGSAQGDLLYFTGSAWAALAAGTSGQFLKTFGAGANPAWANITTMAVIAESVLGADAASIAFTSIPSTYRHLLLVVYARSAMNGANWDDLKIRYNNDSTGNYHYQRVRSGTSSVSTNQTSAEIGVIPANPMPDAQVYGAVVVFIPYYAGSTNDKQFVGISSAVGGTDANVELSGGTHASITAAINQLTIFANGGNLRSGSVATLYGLPTA